MITVIILVILTIMLVVGTIILHHRMKSTDIFSPIFIASFIFIAYAIEGKVLYDQGIYSEDSVILALLYLLIFVAFYALGLLSRLGNTFARAIPTLPTIDHKRLRVFTVLLLPAGLILLLLQLQSAGVLKGNIGVNLYKFRKYYGSGGREYLFVLSMFLIEAPFWGWLVSGVRSISGKLAMGMYLLLLILVSLASGTRGRVFFVLVGFLFIYNCTRKRITLPKVAGIGGLIILPSAFFHVFQGRLRGTNITVDAIKGLWQNTPVWDAISNFLWRFADSFDGFVHILEEFNHLDFLWGRSVYDALFLPIPRVWMPDKPFAFGFQMLYQLRPKTMGTFFGTGYTIMGEFYMNWHIAGIVLGGILFGVLIKVTHRYYTANQANIGFVFLYRPIVLAPWGWISSGIVNSEGHSNLILSLLLSLLFLKLICPRKTRRAWRTATQRVCSSPKNGYTNNGLNLFNPHST